MIPTKRQRYFSYFKGILLVTAIYGIFLLVAWLFPEEGKPFPFKQALGIFPAVLLFFVHWFSIDERSALRREEWEREEANKKKQTP